MSEILPLIERLTNALQDYNSANPYHDCNELIAEARAFVARAAQPLDLDALLSPQGAYEPGTGREDGAQLVDQLEWWAPIYGCDTLETLLDLIRGRILPYLRPPITGIDVPGPDGDSADMVDLCQAEGVDVGPGVRLLKRARKAWDTTRHPRPVPEQGDEGEREKLRAAVRDAIFDAIGSVAQDCPIEDDEERLQEIADTAIAAIETWLLLQRWLLPLHLHVPPAPSP